MASQPHLGRRFSSTAAVASSLGFFLFLTALVSPYVATTVQSATTEPEDFASQPPVLAGYLPEYRSYINVNAATTYLTDLILFSISPNADGSIDKRNCCLDASHYKLGREAKKFQRDVHGRNLRVLVSVGGGGRSDHFGSVAGDPTKRATLLKGLVELCKREHLDGVDFDWEAPHRQSDWQAYNALLREAPSFFRSSNLLITVALHPGQYLESDTYASVDRVHLMTYDMISPEQQHLSQSQQRYPQNIHHAEYGAAVDAVDKLVSSGCPSSKIVMGIPGYGRHRQNLGKVKTYSELVDNILEQYANAPRAPKPGDKVFDEMNVISGYVFDAPQNVREKARYVLQNQLGGLFLWEVGQDKQAEGETEGGVLLKAAFEGLGHTANMPPSSKQDSRGSAEL